MSESLFLRLYSFVLDFTGGISCLLYPLLFYIVLTKSPSSIRIYKYLLCNSLIWSFGYDLLLLVWKPVPLLPYYFGYSTGIGRKFGSTGSYIQFTMALMCYAHLQHGLAWCVIYRYSLTLPPHSEELFSKPKHFFIFGPITYFLYIVVPLVLLLLSRPDFDAFRANLLQQNEGLEAVFQQKEGIFGYDVNLNPLILASIGTAVALQVALNTYVSRLLQAIFSQKKVDGYHNQSEVMKRMHKLMQRVLTIQVSLFIGLLNVPILLVCILAAFGVSHAAQLATSLICVTSFHSLCDCVSLIVFIKQYRNFVIKLISYVWCCEPTPMAFSNLNASSVTPVPTITVSNGRRSRSLAY